MFQPRGRGWAARRPGRSRRGSRSSFSQSRSFPPSRHHEDGELESKILQILYKSHPNPVPVKDILKASPVKYNKKNINHNLYQMKEKGLIDTFEGNPPQWFLLQKGRYAHEHEIQITNSSVDTNTANVGFISKQPVNSVSFSAKNFLNNNSASSSGFLNSSGATISRVSLPTVKIEEKGGNFGSVSSRDPINEPPSSVLHHEETMLEQEPLPSKAFEIDKKPLIEDVSEMNDEQPARQGLDQADKECCSDEEQNRLSDLPPLIEDDLIEEEGKNNESSSEDSSSSSVPSSMNVDNKHSEESGMSRQRSAIPDKSNIKLDPLGEKIYKVLNTNPKVPIADFVKMFKGVHKKKQLNQTLYSMAKQGIVSRSQENPPMWYLNRQSDEMCDKISFGDGDLKNVTSEISDSSSKKSAESSTNQYSVGLLGRRPFPDQYLKQMEAVAISSRGNASGSCIQEHPSVSGYQDFSDPTKNPVSQLMEYVQANRLKVDFKVDVGGPDHRRRFYTTVTLGSEAYSPIEGQSKKDSKTKACEHVLDAIGQSQGLSSSAATNQSASRPLPMQITQPLQQPVVPIFAGASSKNAVSLVNEYAQANSFKIEFLCESYGPDHRKSFRTILRIDRTTYPPVEGASKKDSKLKAAEAALLVLQSTGKLSVNSSSDNASAPQQINTFHDRVAKMVNDKFHSLLLDLPDTVVGRKILAGFVMSRTMSTDAGDETQWAVVSIGSGNRCAGGDKLSMKGDTVNDCHAEIIARRGLLRFMYREIQDYFANPNADENVLTASDDGERLTIKKGIEFHLYISTAPCGDSALFAKSDLRDTDSGDIIEENHGHRPLFENKKQGILRTKVENGEGCIPIDSEALVPTWDGILHGERMRTMSCSDKIAKWNYVGLQGALLSHFLEPFYMSSLTLGMLYSHGHLTRAVCCRVEKFMKLYSKSVSPIYKVHHPKVAKVSGEDPSRNTGKMKTREYSLNWIVGDDRAEVLDGTRGRCEARYGCLNPVSQVSKSSIYAEFKKISKQTYPSYSKAKEAVPHYRQAAEEMKKAFDQAECGTWMSRPSEVEEF